MKNFTRNIIVTFACDIATKFDGNNYIFVALAYKVFVVNWIDSHRSGGLILVVCLVVQASSLQVG